MAGDTFANKQILGFPIDSVSDFMNVAELSKRYFGIDVIKGIDNFRYTFDEAISPLFTQSSISLNLGGKEEKQRIIPTDKSVGIFDFSLASNGLYRVSEYYSQKLADEKPDRFSYDNLPKGVVPSNYVNQSILLGNKYFYFKDTDDQEYPCIVQQKGKAAIDEGVIGAKLKFATRNKKVYLTYKKNKGKVKYVEIYSLFHWGTLSGDLEKGIRHIPILMLAEYLESIGVKTRIYMTRFVVLENRTQLRQVDSVTYIELPQYGKGVANANTTPLFVQPILVKDFGEDIDKNLALSIGQDSNTKIYEGIAKTQLLREIRTSVRPFGYPNWSREDYYEGFERYRNKYKEYVDKGIFVSKEVQTEAMIFFYDYTINTLLNTFNDSISNIPLTNPDGTIPQNQTERLLNINVNPFFCWWMKMSANHVKCKYEIINSTELVSDLKKMKVELQSLVDDMNLFLENQAKDPSLTKLNRTLNIFFESILKGYYLFDNQKRYSFNNYVFGITTEITTYAVGNVYATPPEEVKKRNNLLQEVTKALQNI